MGEGTAHAVVAGLAERWFVRIRWLKDQSVIFLTWAMSSALGFWIMATWRAALLSSLAVLYVADSMQRAWRARFYGQAYTVIAGLLYLIFIFAIDGYLRDGLKHGDLFRRFVKTIGIEMLVLFPADLLTSLVETTLLQGPGTLVIIAELVLGALLTAYSVFENRKRQRRTVKSSGAHAGAREL